MLAANCSQGPVHPYVRVMVVPRWVGTPHPALIADRVRSHALLYGRGSSSGGYCCAMFCPLVWWKVRWFGKLRDAGGCPRRRELWWMAMEAKINTADGLCEACAGWVGARDKYICDLCNSNSGAKTPRAGMPLNAQMR